MTKVGDLGIACHLWDRDGACVNHLGDMDEIRSLQAEGRIHRQQVPLSRQQHRQPSSGRRMRRRSLGLGLRLREQCLGLVGVRDHNRLLRIWAS